MENISSLTLKSVRKSDSMDRAPYRELPLEPLEVVRKKTL